MSAGQLLGVGEAILRVKKKQVSEGKTRADAKVEEGRNSEWAKLLAAQRLEAARARASLSAVCIDESACAGISPLRFRLPAMAKIGTDRGSRCRRGGENWGVAYG